MRTEINFYFKFQIIFIFAVLFSNFNVEGQIQSKPSDKFVDMIGVCVHAARNYSQYTNSTENPNGEQNTIDAITNLRIRHLRDGIYGWNGGVEDFDMDNRGIVTRFSAISQAGANAGIPGGVTWILTDNSNDWRRLRDDYLVPLGNKVTVLEGANENMGVSGNTQAYQQIKNWWNNILPTLPDLKIATNTGPTAACEIVTSGSINDFVHYGNAHPYHFWPPFKPWGKVAHCAFNSTCAPPTISLWTAPDNNGGTIGYLAATRASRVAADKPMVFTEWGYPTIANDAQGWGVSEQTAAKYLARGFLEHFNAGIVYSCSYELMDPEPVSPFSADPEKHFGLAYSDGTLKPSGTAIKRLIALLEDTGNTNITTGTLNYTLSGGGGLSFTDDKNATTNEIHQSLLQKANGKFYLVLWQEAISTNSSGTALDIQAVDVTVNFGQNLLGLKAYLPTTTDNGSPVVNTDNVSSYTFSVPDHPLVIEITPSIVSVTAPTVSTTAVSFVTNTTASSGGNITLDGGVSVTERGVVWGTTTNPTVALTTKTVNGSGTGTFTTSITGLTAGTTYNVRAYATNSVGTSYGSNVVFTASPEGGGIAPTVSTTAVSSVTSTTASSGGNVASDGGVSVTERGVVWGATTNPTVPLTTKTVNGSGTGTFTSSITGLTAGTTYYVRAYATNSVGTSYGSNVVFITTESGSLVSVYPNPATSVVTVDLGQSVGSKQTLVEVLDMQGRKVYTSGMITGVSTLQLNTSEYSKGIYFIRISRGTEKSFTKKLFIE